MAKLWKKLPPPMADNFGFIEVLNKTDGMGIIDDCSEYRTSAERRRRHRENGEAQMRVVHTEIGPEDVVSGTRQKVLDAFEDGRRDLTPEFVLLSAGPCSAMIGTDLEEIAETIGQSSGIKAAAVKLSGHKAYDTGISETLLAMAKLLTKPGNICPGSVNILGATALDWQEENAGALRGWLESRDFSVAMHTTKTSGEGFLVAMHTTKTSGGRFLVTADFGGAERAENIARAAEAQVNLVVTVSGLAAAKYLKSRYGTPYIAAAPFGKSWTERVLEALESGRQPEQGTAGQKPESGGRSGEPECGRRVTEQEPECSRRVAEQEPECSRQAENMEPEVLIICEQFMGNAIRETLLCDYGMENVLVYTFYMMEKSLAQPGDGRLRSEQEAEKLLKEGGFHTIIADPLLRCFAPEGSRWIDLPHRAFQLYGEHPALPLFFGEHLNKWLDEQWRKTAE